jgi:hypothetical protein
MWDEVRSLVEQTQAHAYLAWDLAFLKSGVAIVVTPGPQVLWTQTLIAQPRRAKKVTDLVQELRLRSLTHQVAEWHLEDLVPLLSGVFAETPEQFQFALAKRGKGSRYSSIIATGMIKAFVMTTMYNAGWESGIVFVDPKEVDKHLSGSFAVTQDLIERYAGKEAAQIVAKSMSKAKVRRRFCVAEITGDVTWWDVHIKKLVRSDDESDAAAIGIVGAQMAEFARVDDLRVSWRR